MSRRDGENPNVHDSTVASPSLEELIRTGIGSIGTYVTETGKPATREGKQRKAALDALDVLLAKLERAAFVAEHLFQMVDPQTWRDSGAIGPEGQYEGEYRAAQLWEEIKSWTT